MASAALRTAASMGFRRRQLPAAGPCVMVPRRWLTASVAMAAGRRHHLLCVMSIPAAPQKMPCL
eukprot:8831866-Prorocentrum_lima.AAC.1